MSTDAASRAAVRRLTWTGGKARTGRDADVADLEFWHRATASDRFNAILQMALDWCAIQEARAEPESGFQGPAHGIRQRRG